MFRAGLYARVSTNDQQTLAMQEPGDAGVCRPARLDDRHAGPRGELRGGTARSAREATRCRPTPGDRFGAGVAAGWGRSVTDLLATLQELEHQRWRLPWRVAGGVPNIATMPGLP